MKFMRECYCNPKKNMEKELFFLPNTVTYTSSLAELEVPPLGLHKTDILLAERRVAHVQLRVSRNYPSLDVLVIRSSVLAACRTCNWFMTPEAMLESLPATLETPCRTLSFTSSMSGALRLDP